MPTHNNLFITCVADAIMDKNMEREILNHRCLVHPNVLAFREVFATEDELAIVVCAHSMHYDRMPASSQMLCLHMLAQHL